MKDPIVHIDVLDKGYVELLDSMGDDNTIVAAARVSLLGESKGEEKDKQLIKYLLENKHTSPFEQVEFRFRVKCPLFIRSQWMRHRTWSYNEVSRRYTSEDIEFYYPTTLRRQADVNRQASTDEEIDTIYDEMNLTRSDDRFVKLRDFLKYNMLFAKCAYDTLIKYGVSREQARMVLPQGMYTQFYAKTDLHNLLHFLELRDSPHAQYEMRLYAKALRECIKDIVPWTIEAWDK